MLVSTCFAPCFLTLIAVIDPYSLIKFIPLNYSCVCVCVYIYYGEAIHQRCRQMYIYAYTAKNAGWYIYIH